MNADNFRSYRNGFNCQAVPCPFTPESDDRWYFEASLNTAFFDSGSMEIFRSDDELVENLSWNVRLDTIPPELSFLSAIVDSAGMAVLVEALCTDQGSGIGETAAYIDNLEHTQQVLREELHPFVIDGNIIQFRPQELLEDGTFSVIVRLSEQGGSIIAEHSWSFTVETMTSIP